jgi:hypothetical protein
MVKPICHAANFCKPWPYLFEYRDGIPRHLYVDVYAWCEENIDTWYYVSGNFYFRNHIDATAFKMKWC